MNYCPQAEFFSYFGWPEGEMTFSNKDPHHGGLLCHYGCFALENQLTPSQDPLRKGLAEGDRSELIGFMNWPRKK